MLTRFQQALLVSSNGNEGALFTPASQLVADSFTLNTYVTKLFPRLSKQQVQQAVQLYSQSGGSVTDQATAIMGDCKLNIYTPVRSLNKLQLFLFARHMLRCQPLARTDSKYGDNPLYHGFFL